MKIIYLSVVLKIFLISICAPDAFAIKSNFIKHGNNGTTSCANFCAGPQWWGDSGSCVKANHGDTNLSCTDVPGLYQDGSEITCTCGDWTYCDNDNHAYFMQNNEKILVPLLDRICNLPQAKDSGELVQGNTNRCIVSDKRICRVGEGGVNGPGEHSVPSSAWYQLAGVLHSVPLIRCECGCFVGDMMIGSLGDKEKISALAERAKFSPVQVDIYRPGQDAKVSNPLSGKDFTVGPEKKPVVKVVLSSGKNLIVSDQHPMYVQRSSRFILVRAIDLEKSDLLQSEDGPIESIESISTYLLPKNNNLVYNLDTKERDSDNHLIFANGVVVGDLHLQKRLSELNSRIQNILESAKS